MFDDFLRDWSTRHDVPFEEFDRPTDYDEYVDGKPRLDGVKSFLESRGIDLPMGSPSDPAEAETIHALGTRKNDLVLELIREQGVEPYEGSVRFAEAARDQGLRRAVVSSSTNCKDVLEAAGIDQLFEVRIDGVVAEREGLAGKPAPDTFLAGARALDAEASEAAVFEDAQAGVEAGRAGNFGWVVGVDRTGQAEALRRRGADVVVDDLAELLQKS
jgi:HAD superfamily hydrolase (TIGR01509 family)